MLPLTIYREFFVIKYGECKVSFNCFSHIFQTVEVEFVLRFNQLTSGVTVSFNMSIGDELVLTEHSVVPENTVMSE